MIRIYIVAATLLAGGCATDGGKSLIVLHNQALDDECVVGGMESSAAIGRGRLLPSSPRGYVFTPVIKSLVLESNSDSVDRSVLLLGADITIEDEGGSEVVSFGQTFTTTVTPGGTSGLAFEITPPGSELGSGQFKSIITVYGRLGDGEVEADPFPYWIEVSDDASALDLGACSALEPGYVGSLAGHPCNPYQESAIECCSEGSTLVCPAEGPPAL